MVKYLVLIEISKLSFWEDKPDEIARFVCKSIAGWILVTSQGKGRTELHFSNVSENVLSQFYLPSHING